MPIFQFWIFFLLHIQCSPRVFLTYSIALIFLPLLMEKLSLRCPSNRNLFNATLMLLWPALLSGINFKVPSRAIRLRSPYFVYSRTTNYFRNQPHFGGRTRIRTLFFFNFGTENILKNGYWYGIVGWNRCYYWNDIYYINL